MASDKDIISEAKEAYRLGLDAESENRQSYIEDYRFARLDEHWPSDVKDARQREGRPTLTIPRLQAFIRQVVNDSRQNRPRIRVKPVDSLADVKTAQVIDGLILNIEQASNAAAAYDTAIDCAVSGGFGYIRCDIEYAHGASFDKEIRISRVANPLQVVGDPYSQAVDSSDWNTAFLTTMLTKDEFKRQYKSADPSSWHEADYTMMAQPWLDGNEVMIAEWWKRSHVDKVLIKLTDGRVMYEEIFIGQAQELIAGGLEVEGTRKTKGYEVTQHLLTGAEVLNTVKWAGCYIPIIPVYGEEMNIEGKRIFRSLINPAKDAQRRYNYWMSAATEIVALAPKTPFIGEQRAFDLEPEKWATVNSVSHSHIAIPTGAQIPQRQPLDGGQAVGAISGALAASDDIKAILGMYDASLGQRSNETSGKAIMARQREGDVSTFHFIDNLSRGIQHLGKVIVDLIPSVYTPGMIVRVLGQDGRVGTAKVENRMPGAPKPEFSPLDEEAPPDSEHVFDLGVGRYDVTVDAGPSFTSRREETANQMIELIRSYPDAAPLIGDVLVKNLDWPEAEEIAERLKRMLPQQAMGEDAIPPEMKQMIAEGQEAIQTLTAENQKLTQEAEMGKHQQAMAKMQQQLQDQAHQMELQEKDLVIQRMQAIEAVEDAAEGQAQQQEAQPQQPQASPVSISVPDNLGQLVAESIAPIIAQTVAQAVSQAMVQTMAAMPPIKVDMPRMKRTPVRDRNGMIVHAIDEPMVDPMEEMMN